jgi:hypothetical protein
VELLEYQVHHQLLFKQVITSEALGGGGGAAFFVGGGSLRFLILEVLEVEVVKRSCRRGRYSYSN